MGLDLARPRMGADKAVEGSNSDKTASRPLTGSAHRHNDGCILPPDSVVLVSLFLSLWLSQHRVGVTPFRAASIERGIRHGTAENTRSTNACSED